MKFKRDIRGRDYFYDYRGNVVIVNQTDHDKPTSNRFVSLSLSLFLASFRPLALTSFKQYVIYIFIRVNMKVTIEKASEASNNEDADHNIPTTTSKPKRSDPPHQSKGKRHTNQPPTDPSAGDSPFYKEIKLSQPSVVCENEEKRSRMPYKLLITRDSSANRIHPQCECRQESHCMLSLLTEEEEEASGTVLLVLEVLLAWRSFVLPVKKYLLFLYIIYSFFFFFFFGSCTNSNYSLRNN